jgi:phosphatidylglycerophosphate synthase
MIAGSLYLYRQKVYVAANLFGKINTALLFLALTALLVFPLDSMARDFALAVSVLFNAVTLFRYIGKYFPFRKKKEGDN